MKPLRISKNNTTILRNLSLFLLFVFILFPLSEIANSQTSQNVVGNRIALKLDGSDSDSFTAEQLEKAREIGIDLLELSFPNDLNRSVLNQFYLLLDTGQRFQTVYQLRSKSHLIRRSILESYDEVPNPLQDNIVAIKLFDFPADYDPRFPEIVRDSLSHLSDSLEKPIYYQSAFEQPGSPPVGFDFISSRVTVQDSSASIKQTVLLFSPSENVNSSLQMLENTLNHSLNYSESVTIIPADWFFKRMQDQASFSEIIALYLQGNTVMFPMPKEEQDNPDINWPIIFLLVLWASFMVHYKYQPMYRASLPRYFFNHSFFVHDVIEQRIRNTTSGVIVLLQHSLLTGLFFYILTEAFVSTTGLDALHNHFPLVVYPGYEKISLFVIGIVISLFSHIVSVLWLYLLNKKLPYLNQVINLYSWPLHLNLIIVTLVIYFTQLSAAHNWLIVAVIAYFIVWFFSFKIAAIDGAKFLEKFRLMNLFLTVGIHFLLITAAIVLIFWLPFIFEPIKMAFLLP